MQRKFDADLFPKAMGEAKSAANKGGLNAKQRLNKRGKYSPEAIAKKREMRKKVKNPSPGDKLSTSA